MSGYTFAEVTLSQKLPDWVGSHVRAFNFFGCVPEIVVPDNLKSAVTKPCRYEPELNATYADMARHYGVAIIPARPYKPRDKAMVELGVMQISSHDGQAVHLGSLLGEVLEFLPLPYETPA